MIFGSHLEGPGRVERSAFGSLFHLLEQSWVQDGPKWSPDLSKTPRGTDFRGFWAPTWRILGPSLVEFEAHLGPGWSQDPSKTPQTPPKTNFLVILDTNFEDFRSQLERCCYCVRASRRVAVCRRHLDSIG